jgi:hypothetical protein
LQILRENKTSPTSQAQQNKVCLMGVLVFKSLRKTRKVQLYRPGKIKFDLRASFLANRLRKPNELKFICPAKQSWTSGGGLGSQILRENETSPTLQARRNKVGLMRVSGNGTWKENENKTNVAGLAE